MESLHVFLEVRDDLAPQEKAVCVFAWNLGSRQTGLPIRCVESEGIPSMIAPGVSGLRRLLQNDVRPILLAQVITDGEPRLPATDDNGLNMQTHVFTSLKVGSRRIRKSVVRKGCPCPWVQSGAEAEPASKQQF